MARAVSLQRYAGLGDVSYEQMTREQKLTFLATQLHAIAQLTGEARMRGDAVTVARMRDLFTVVANRFAALRGEAAKADAPSSFMLKLDAFSDEAIKVGKQVGAVAGAAAEGATGLLKNLPMFLLVALVVIGIAAVGYTKHGGVTVRRVSR